MTTEEDRIQTVEGALQILEVGTERKLSVPLETAFYAGLALVITALPETYAQDNQRSHRLITYFEGLIPPELVRLYPDDYLGDLTTPIPLHLNALDVEHIALKALSVPGGKRIIDALPIAPSEKGELDQFRIKHLRAALTLLQEFIEAGGSVNQDIVAELKRELGDEDTFTK